MNLTYSDSAVTGARRQIKSSNYEISLMRLLQDMRRQSTLLTLKNYCRFHDDKDSDRDGFNFYSNGQKKMLNERLFCDVDKLKIALEKIQDFADFLVAHPSKKILPNDKKLTLNDLINGIKILIEKAIIGLNFTSDKGVRVEDGNS